MGNPKDTFDQDLTPEEQMQRQAVHEQQRSDGSHLHGGGIFDPSSPNYRPIKKTVIGEDENIEDVVGDRQREVLSAAEQKQALRRTRAISETVQNALLNRPEASGPDTMKVTHDEFVKMLQDPEFDRFSKYSQDILYYADHVTPRPKPLREFLKNEVGMWRGKIVCLKNMPDQSSRGDIPYVQVPAKLEANPLDRPNVFAPLEVVPDPFPEPKKTIGIDQASGPDKTSSVIIGVDRGKGSE